MQIYNCDWFKKIKPFYISYSKLLFSILCDSTVDEYSALPIKAHTCNTILGTPIIVGTTTWAARPSLPSLE